MIADDIFSCMHCSFPLFSHSVTSDSLWHHGLQHARVPCPSLSPSTCSNSCPLNRWCHPTISSSVSLFSFCLQCFLASGSFPMTPLFASGGQSTGALASASVLPKSLLFHFCFFHIQLKWLLSLSAKPCFEYLTSFSCHKEFSYWIFHLKKKGLFFLRL